MVGSEYSGMVYMFSNEMDYLELYRAIEWLEHVRIDYEIRARSP